MDSFDLVIIGAGPAGYVGAIRAAQLGMKVALVEKDALGGVCLNIGCIPSKALLDATHEYYLAKHRFAARGIKVGEISVDLAQLMGFKDKVVRQLTGGVGSLMKKNGVEHVKGTGKLLGGGKVEVNGAAGKRVLEGKNLLIASGSKPSELPNLKCDGKRVVDSTGALAFTEVPKSLVVVGAGAIGLELGSVWSRLGAQVTFVEFLDHIAGTADTEMGGALQKLLEKQGMKFRLSTKVVAAQVEAERVVVKVEPVAGGAAEALTADRVLVSVGRRPNVEELNLKEAGVKLTSRGMIEVGEHFKTSAGGVYAVGDCIGGAMLAHKASDEAIACVERLAGVSGHVNYEAIPNIIYTAPELATVGMSENAAKEQGRAVKVGKFPFMANGRAKCMDETEGSVKIIADAQTDRVLGVTILHARASDLIAEAAIAMEYKASAEDIARSAHAHPTLAEAIKEAALAADGRVIHL
jgi:dihydrolipoamide dehydrogenase